MQHSLKRNIPGLEAHKGKHEVVMLFKEDMETPYWRQQTEIKMIMQLFSCVLLKFEYRYSGSLLDEQHDSHFTFLLALVQLILGGTNIVKQTENNQDVKTAATSITELLTFNAVKRGRKSNNAIRHSVDRETKLLLYLGLLVHNKTRKQDLIDTQFERGLSVSYDTVLHLSTDTANAIID